jgi:hypothetical protein
MGDYQNDITMIFIRSTGIRIFFPVRFTPRASLRLFRPRARLASHQDKNSRNQSQQRDDEIELPEMQIEEANQANQDEINAEHQETEIFI